jgi:hypothetical protein
MSAVGGSGIDTAWPQAGNFLSADGRAIMAEIAAQFDQTAIELSDLQAFVDQAGPDIAALQTKTGGLSADGTHLDGVIVGATTRAAGNFTTLNASGTTTIGPTPSAGASDFNIVGDGAARNAVMLRFQNNSVGPSVNFRKARGTAAAPAIITSGDQLGALNAFAYDGTQFWANPAASIVFGTEGTIGTGVTPGTVRMSTQKSDGGVADALYIDSAQNVYLNKASGSFSAIATSAGLRTSLIDTASGDLTFAPSSGLANVTGFGLAINNTTNAARLYSHTNSYTWSIGNMGATAGPNAFAIIDDIVGSARFAVDTSGNVALGGYFGSEALRAVPGAWVNRVEAYGAGAGGTPYLVPNGTDINTALVLAAKGNEGIAFRTAGGALNQVVVAHTPSADRYLTLTGGNSGVSGSAAIGTNDGDLGFLPSSGTSTFAAGAVGIMIRADGGAPAGLFGAYTNHPLYVLASGSFQAQFGAVPTTDAWLVMNGSNGSNPSLLASQRNLQLGSGTLATNASAGFITFPNCAGTPTGTPSSNSVVIDTTNSRLYVRVGSTWKSCALT